MSIRMNLNTSQIREMMKTRPGVIGLKPLCESAGVNYKNLYKRMERGGGVRADEGRALGRALVCSMPDGFISICISQEDADEV